MTYALNQIAPAPHLLDPKRTVETARQYYNRYALSVEALTDRIAEHKRAIEHEQAILAGMELALTDLLRKRRGR